MSLQPLKEMLVSKLRANERNARTHSKKQVAQIAESMRRFGVTSPIVADENGNILCGAGRWLAAQKLGLKTVSVIEKSGLSDAEKRALMLADNKIAQNSGWDRKLLAAELGELAIHPTVKPVALIADAMRDCSRRGDIVLDPFMGSGTAILAAKRVGRRGYGLEIDPLYVDVVIRRWQAFTGRDAVLKVTGQTFDEVTADRTPPAKKKAP